MRVFQPNIIAEPVGCPYFAGREFVQEVYFADRLVPADVDEYINHGFRRFGAYFFRPVCTACKDCRPIRVSVNDFTPSKSLKRILKAGRGVQARVFSQQELVSQEGQVTLNEDYYKIYERHSVERFGISTTRENFLESFFYPASQQMIVEYSLEGRLFGIGFLDLGENFLSSIYFAYLPEYETLSPGHLSVMIEINIAKAMKIPWYCLGYWIENNSHMNYKTRYEPHHFLDWDGFVWRNAEGIAVEGVDTQKSPG